MTSFRDKPTTNLFAATIFRKQEVDYVEKIIPDPFIYWIAVINVQDDRDLAKNPRRRIKVDLQHFKLYFVTRKYFDPHWQEVWAFNHLYERSVKNKNWVIVYYATRRNAKIFWSTLAISMGVQPFIFKKGTSGVLHYFYNLDLKVFRINLRSGGPFQNGCLSKLMVAISTTYSDQTKNVLNATHTGFILWIFNNLQQHCHIFTQKYYQIKMYINKNQF